MKRGHPLAWGNEKVQLERGEGGSQVLANREGHGGLAREAQCRRVRIKPQGGAWGVGLNELFSAALNIITWAIMA